MEAIKRILILGEEPCYSHSLSRHLKREGFFLSMAGKLFEASTLMQQGQKRGEEFHCIIIDIAKDGGDGLETLQWLKQNYPEMPAIVIYGFGAGDAVRASMSSSRDECCQKPLTPQTLMQLLQRVEEKQREN